MGEVIKKYFQKCDICKKEFEVGEKAQLGKLLLPVRGAYNDTVIEKIDVCASCIADVLRCLEKDFVLKDVEWAGTFIERKD